MPILVDIDNTLAATDEQFLRLLNRRFGTRYRRSQLTTYWIEQALKLSREQVEYLDELAADPGFYRDLQPLRGASAGVQLLVESDEIVYVSARPTLAGDATIEWLDRHLFPVGALQVGVTDKVPVARDAGCDSAIEDAPDNAWELSARLGIPVCLIDCPWNQSLRVPGITRVGGWNELATLLRRGDR